jgi:hypothetical protein
MKLDSPNPGASVPLYRHPLNWSSKSDISPAKPEVEGATWVQLQEPPSPYSHDEALLLCRHSETEWIVWIPEYGEMVLHQSQYSDS